MQAEDFAGPAYPPPVTLLAGRYRLSSRLLGRGGLADVWAGVDEQEGRPVAVKLFRPGPELPDRQRVDREVRTLAGLSHPHLISLYDAGEAEGRAFLVMPQVPGGTLSGELYVSGPLPAQTVRRIGAQIASALAYIHQRGIVHRDVKPANILLDGAETAVLADFGIARLIDGTLLTSTGLTIGTAAYLSPEQVRGRQVGAAADVYALGLVLLEALTGRREYPGDPVEAAVARLYRQPDVPENLPYGLPGLLRAMTAEDAAARPSAGSVSDVLNRPVAAVPSQIRAVAGLSPADATKPVLIPVRRRRRKIAWLVPAAITIGATVSVIALHPQGAPGDPGTAGRPPAAGSSPAGATSTAAPPAVSSQSSEQPSSPTPSATTVVPVLGSTTNVASESAARPGTPSAHQAGGPGNGQGPGHEAGPGHNGPQRPHGGHGHGKPPGHGRHA